MIAFTVITDTPVNDRPNYKGAKVKCCPLTYSLYLIKMREYLLLINSLISLIIRRIYILRDYT